MVPVSPHSLPTLTFFFYKVIAILTGVGCYLIVTLICIFLMIGGVEHLFISLLVICMSSLEKRLSPLPTF